MKKKTPMQMRKEGAGKKPPSKAETSKPQSAMDRYVQKRSKKPAPPVMIESKK